MSNATLNLFPERIPTGKWVDADGKEHPVWMTLEFARALSDLFVRVGGATGLGSDDLALLVFQAALPAPDVEARGAIAALELGAPPRPEAAIHALSQRLEELALLSTAVAALTADVAALRQRDADIEQLATHRDPFRVDWERPGKIGLLTPNTIAAAAGTVAAPGFYLGADTATGFYRIGADNWGWSASGTKMLEWAATGMTIAQPITSTVVTGTAPLVIASTTKVPNLNADKVDGQDWADPGPIGGGTPAAGAFTTLTSSGAAGFNGAGAQAPYPLGAAPTDPASTQTTAANCRLALIAWGIGT